MRLAQLGDVFSGRYELLKILGSGGFATVFLGRDNTIGREVVLKVLTPQNGRYPHTVRARFQREAHIFGDLQSPHIVTMYDFGESPEGLLYMVFEYVAGDELTTYVSNKTLPLPAAMHILEQLLSALEEAHNKGILHRDIKPANVLVYPYGDDPYRVKLLDFGIAKDTTNEGKGLTKTGAVIGTMRYMSPEQLTGEPLSASSDIYSLGLVAYEMLTGRPAIGGESQRDMVTQQLDPTDITVPPNAAPPEVRRVIDGMLRKEVSARLRTARDVLQLLHTPMNTSEPLAAARPLTRPLTRPPTRPPTRTVEVQAPPPTSRRWVVGVLCLTALLGGVAVTFLIDTPQGQPQRIVPVKKRDSLFASETALQAPIEQAAPADASDATHDALPLAATCEPPPFVGFGTLPTEVQSTIFIPKDATGPIPLVAMFHRNFRTGAEFIRYSGITQVAEEHKFAVIAFESNATLGWADELYVKVARSIESLFDELCLDRAQLYTIGDDHGARLAWTLPCMIPVTAHAVVFDRSARSCEPVVPTSRMRIYGKHDKYAPSDGSLGCNPLEETARAARIEEAWSRRMKCADTSTPWGDYTAGECEHFACEDASHVVCAGNLNHQWPGGPPSLVSLAACEADLRGELFPMSEALWKFFSESEDLTPEQLERHVGTVRKP